MKKKIILAAASIALLSLPAISQGLYLGIGGGYAFPAGRQSLSQIGNGIDQKTVVENGVSRSDLTVRPVSLGQGINAGLYAGYMFNKNVGAELGFSYLSGMPITFQYERNDKTSKSLHRIENRYEGSMLRIVPAIRISAGEEKLRPYAKVGMIIGVGGMITHEEQSDFTSPNSKSNSVRTMELSGGLSLGFHGGLGVNYFVTDHLGIYLEVAANMQSYAPSKGIITKYSSDGKDQLPGMERNEKEMIFHDNFFHDSSIVENKDEPGNSLKFHYPFSSAGLNIGIHYSFGGKD